MKTELITIDEIDVPALFKPTPEGEEDKVDTLLDKIDQAVSSIVIDVTTSDGRKNTASIAAKIPRLKTAIDGVRKDIVSAEKKKLAAIDARGKRIKDGLDKIRTDFRQPLTEFEEKDKAIKAMREENINKLSAWLADIQLTQDLDDLERLFSANALLFTTADWGDRMVEAREITTSISSAYETKKTQLLEAIRLSVENARLKREAEERAQQEREDRIARDAVENARREQAEIREAAERKAKAQKEATDVRRREAEEAKLQAVRDALEAQRREIEQAKQAIEDKKQAAIAAEEKRKADVAEAARLERDRIAEEKRQQEAEAAARADDKAHRAAINNRAVECMVEGGVSVTAAKKAVTLIAQGKIEAVTISY